MVIHKLFQPWKMLMVQKSLKESTNVLFTIRKGLGHVFKYKKDLKGLGRKGRLTDAKIDTLQKYFDSALPQDSGDINKMISACTESMFQTIMRVPKDRLNFYKDKGGLPLDVCADILPVYNDLCKCLHGRTQNRNESFNGMLWNRVPKANDIFLWGFFDAIAHFNDGAIASLEILKDMNMESGDHMSLARYIQHTGSPNHNLKAEKLSDIVGKKTSKTILIRRDQLTRQENFESE